MSHAAHQPHITGYKILSDPTPDQLCAQIEVAIHNGWQPWGPLSVIGKIDNSDTQAAIYYQAIVQQSEWFR
ncbi:MAG: DUF1737 domain-containing protein [Rhodobacteraceae bacterium]|nr:DUF1737 domain-containing protein [Paracoccaceae bacterium]